MQSRRDFLRNAALLSGVAFVWGSVPEAIARAMEIDPEEGTTFLDAEHIVFLMQENRSFDHAYGALRGVRGFRDPRAHVQPNGRKVWFQTDAKGKTFAPFRLDIEGTNSTWIGGLPHSWPDQVDARNGGRYDKWLIAKARQDLPLAMGYYAREDLPFYYALADAFTVCDQAFCSSLTGTTPNRLYLWTGTIREDAGSPARVQNGDTDYGREAAWKTYPERLEEAGVSWRIYQNEISLDSGFVGEEDSWLSNFTDNPIEWFSQYRVRFAKGHRRHLDRLATALPDEIAAKRKQAADPALGDEARKKLADEIAKAESRLKAVEAERAIYNDAAWNALSERERALHEKAFTTNEGDPDYRKLEAHRYRDGEVEREMQVPKGDVLYRFRKDVDSGQLPAVSWIVAPENFSDHPSSGWYGAWYLSEVMNILTKNPEVWKKTIFVLCYDENDGYFDHVPPFVAPHPDRPETGKVSAGIDTRVDVSDNHRRDSSIGLGYRCPLVVASPWSRGGCVNSQVFDHTSMLMLVEQWLAGKGKAVSETNISDWRRTVCGDMTSVFRPFKGEKYDLPKPLDRNASVERIHQAKFRSKVKPVEPVGDVDGLDLRPFQESGTRPSCPLPYELETNAEIREGRLVVTMEARNRRLGRKAVGSAFNAYAYGGEMLCRSYAVKAGDRVEDAFDVSGAYHVRVDGPNGFMRDFRGNPADGKLKISVQAEGQEAVIRVTNGGTTAADVTLRDEAYGQPPQRHSLPRSKTGTYRMRAAASRGWYDFTVKAGELAYRYAGRIETGKWSVTDPAMG
ncbi:MAG: phosphocholine-specific phospholipase C [Fimbriimonas sp.]